MFNGRFYCGNSIQVVFSSFEVESEEEVMMSYNADGELEMNTNHELEQDEKQDHERECSSTLTN